MYSFSQMTFSVSRTAFHSVGFVIGSAYFKDSKSSLSGGGFIRSESYKFFRPKILARELIPRLMKRNYYEANALPSALAGPGFYPYLFVIIFMSTNRTLICLSNFFNPLKWDSGTVLSLKIKHCQLDL